MTEHLTLEGHGMTASFADGVLRVVAGNSVARGALGAAERSILVNEITAVEYIAPTLLKNGSVVVESPVGKTAIYFLRKRAEAAQSLHRLLLDRSGANADAKVTARFANERLQAFEARAAERLDAMAQRVTEAEAKRVEARERARAEFEAARAEFEAARGAAAADMKTAWRDLKESWSGGKGDWFGVVQSTSAGRLAELTALLDEAEVPRPFDIDLEVEAVGAEVSAAGRARTATELATFALEQAQAAAKAGSVAREEEMILTARAAARLQADRAERKQIESLIQLLISHGKLRRGAQLLGTIHSERGLDRWLRKGAKPSEGSGERWIEIWSDRVATADAGYPISAQTSAQVYLDGQAFITQRPTLTRMALFAPLPGSALLPGLAMQKKTTTDHRVAEIQIRDVNWALRAALQPDALSTPRRLAEQVNAAADLAGRSTHQQHASAPDLLTQLERLAFLIDKGLISGEEANAIKAAMITATA